MRALAALLSLALAQYEEMEIEIPQKLLQPTVNIITVPQNNTEAIADQIGNIINDQMHKMHQQLNDAQRRVQMALQPLPQLVMPPYAMMVPPFPTAFQAPAPAPSQGTYPAQGAYPAQIAYPTPNAYPPQATYSPQAVMPQAPFIPADIYSAQMAPIAPQSAVYPLLPQSYVPVGPQSNGPMQPMAAAPLSWPVSGMGI